MVFLLLSQSTLSQLQGFHVLLDEQMYLQKCAALIQERLLAASCHWTKLRKRYCSSTLSNIGNSSSPANPALYESIKKQTRKRHGFRPDWTYMHLLGFIFINYTYEIYNVFLHLGFSCSCFLLERNCHHKSFRMQN